jgi:hypothetical protein
MLSEIFSIIFFREITNEKEKTKSTGKGSRRTR